MTTNNNKKKNNGKNSNPVKDFELSEEFKDKYGFVRIYTQGKNLVLTTYKGQLILSKYNQGDINKTIDDLQKEFMKNKDAEIDFTDNDMEQFLKEFKRMLGWRIIQDSQEEEEAQKEQEEEQQEKDLLQQEIQQLKEQNKNITSKEWVSKLHERYQNLKDVIEKEMPEIWEGLEFELSISRILNIEDCTLPFIGIILGAPSSYKTVIIELLKKWRNTYFTDNFTPKSFVSHSTSVNSEEELRHIDMLPRMKHNIFLTPELSPMFTTKEEDLTQLLGIITRIADGHGYSCDSGAHGHRGYDEDIMFTWVGASVDIPYKVYKILNNLGHRLYFYRLHFKDESLEELTEYAIQNKGFNTKKARIQEALFDYLKWLEINPDLIEDPNGIDTTNKKIRWNYSKEDREAIKVIAGIGDVLSYLRCIAQVYMTEDSQGSDYSYTISPKELPRRAITALSNLARGHASLEGRNYITMDDISIVVKTATDSAMVERVSLFGLLIASNGSLSTNQILQSLNVSKKTALRTMAEFKTIGLVDIEDFHEDGQNYLSRRMVLKSRFEWLLKNSTVTKIFPHTLLFFNNNDGAKGEVHDTSDNASDKDKDSNFWGIFNELEAQNNNGKVINHDKLHEALVSSGKFYVGDATQIISDMVNAGKLEVVSFNEYKKRIKQD